MLRSLLVASLALVGIAVVQPANAAGVRVYIHQEMTDYATFRKHYDAFDATRRKMGVTAQTVYQSVDNKNDVTITHDFKSLDKAKAFAAMPELKADMEKVGKGPPQVWFTTLGAK
jgi:hypothetical protein